MAKQHRQLVRTTVGLNLISPLTPLNSNQEAHLEILDDLISSAKHDSGVMLVKGPAGTGKSFVTVHKAIQALMEGKVGQVKIFRSIVPVREIGHLPGTIEEKTAPYEQIYVSMVNKIFGRADAYEILKKKKLLTFDSTSFVRGDTFDNSVIIVDEAANCSFEELDALLTRTGEGSVFVVLGDEKQSDLVPKRNQTKDWTNVADIIEYIINNVEANSGIVTYGPEDIVRSGLVKAYILRRDGYV